ncbi:hypothetical protein [Microbacterium galbinum]|uniref:Winged helix-turn-helix domain-containing protein n=1 Tax=Microbacterium galbinum TaxID=2851646 RepID=A0ABY4IJS8_9MICO|nr:hypothetical protein [Microbacterium galbinum]UPL13036.1 hypothetical protein KV396_00365 [Microbacterium galbinum]
MTLSRPRTITVAAFRQIRRLPPALRATAEGLRMHADDHGRGRVELRQILADVYPEQSDVTESVLVDHLLELAEADVLVLYEERGVSLYAFTHWGRIDRPTRSELPEPPPFARRSREPRESRLAGEREGERERESGGASESASAGAGETPSARMSREVLPPNPFCEDHPGGVLEPCIACQNARLRNKHFLDIRRWEMRQGEGAWDEEPF